MTPMTHWQPLRLLQLVHCLYNKIRHGVDHIEVLCPGWQHDRPKQVAAALQTDSRRVSTVIMRLVFILHQARDGGSSLRQQCQSRAGAPLSCQSNIIGTSRLCLPIPSSPKVRPRWVRHDIVVRLHLAHLLQLGDVAYQRQVSHRKLAVIRQQRLGEGPTWVTRTEQGTNSTTHRDVGDPIGAGPGPGWQFPPGPRVFNFCRTPARTSHEARCPAVVR